MKSPSDRRRKAVALIFAAEGRYGQVLLALEVFAKKTNKTPPAKLALARQRLNDWRSR